MKIRAQYYLIGGTVHIAVNGVVLCSLVNDDPEHVVCQSCHQQRLDRITRDEARKRVKCGDCLKTFLELQRVSDFLEALPTTPS